MRKLVPILAITALFRGLSSLTQAMDGGILRSMRTTPARPVLAGAAVLLGILAAVLFTGQSASAQSDSDALPRVTVSFSDLIGKYVAEGGSTTIGVTLSEDPQREVVIPITVTNRGGATPADYSSLPSSVTFSSEECYDDEDDNCYETYKSFSFAPSEDSEDDDGESVQFGIGAPLPAGVSVRGRGMTTVWIIDGGEVYVGLAQVGVGLFADLRDQDENFSNETWQWQRSETETGAYTDIPATEGGTSNPYTPLRRRSGQVAQSEGHLR